jgi:membrane fusion protein
MGMDNGQNDGLFRLEAIDSCKAKTVGSIIIVRPPSFFWLTIGAAACFLALLLFSIFGTYTKHVTVRGELLPITGHIQVFAAQGGIVLAKLIQEGQHVQKGDVLYILSTERETGERRGVQGEVSEQIKKRRELLEEELKNSHALNASDRHSQTIHIESLSAELSALERQIQNQKERLQVTQDGLKRYYKLQSQGFISSQQLGQKREEELEQEKQLRALERERIIVDRQLRANQANIRSQLHKHDVLVTQLERGISALSQELAESEAKRRLHVVAPRSGIATAVLGEPGQAVDPTRSLLSIIPPATPLFARLYAPSKAIGLVQAGKSVVLRYPAFPYEKFGHASGRIDSISRVPIPSEQLKGQGSSSGANEPMYLISARIEKQYVDLDGRKYALQSGMLLEADLPQSERKIYEWILEPLYSQVGKQK